MTYEKAIGWMMVKKQCIIECPDEPNDASKELIEAYNMAIEALDKQIPQKVVFHDNCGNKSASARCPNCFEVISSPYCGHCGQRIEGDQE